ncbi:hypothetical protein MNBD_ALPHA06-2072 [hydrothermal vent metagenome]|uniref:HTH cro/C1-type domain-containing protein n=1 Tax=hydrothermal vent metagenome TaxID=652676 RepID=A0A3B0S095_9ZZZZ
MDATGVIAKAYTDESGVNAAGGSIGQALREARKRAGLELQQVSDDLKICSRYLQAIENMDRNTLPHQAYALGFVRCYASYLGFNPQTSVEQFKAEDGIKAPSHQDISVRQPPFWLDFTVPRGIGAAIAVVGILGLAGWFGGRNENIPHMIPAVPEMLGTWANGDELRDMPPIQTNGSVSSIIEP